MGLALYSWTSSSSATGFFQNGGNSFGATATLGTDDANILNIRTGGTTAISISAAQVITTVNNTLDSGTTVGNASFHGTITSGSTAATATNGSLTLNGSTSGTVVLSTGATGAATLTTPVSVAMIVNAVQRFGITTAGVVSTFNNTLDSGGSAGNATFHGTITSGSTAATATNGSLTLNGSTSGTVVSLD